MIEELTIGNIALLSLGFVSVSTILVLVDKKRRSPEKSYKNHLVNMMLVIPRALGMGFFKKPLTLENAFKYATRKTGLSDFGDSGFAEGYQMVLQTVTQKKQRYTNLGFISARIELNMTFVRRLKMIEYLKQVPRILSIGVPGPVFVMGLPRTGTTLLHRLLSLDPQVRAPLLWELLAPVPHKSCKGTEGSLGDVMESFDKDNKYRADFIRKLMKTRKSMGDKAVEHIHEIEWDLPEECFMTLSDEIPCLVQYFYSAYVHNEETEPMFRKQIVSAYKHHKKYLQMLSYQANEGGLQSENGWASAKPRRWMLKCPIHLYYPKEIGEVFPDAKLIWTHRHPVSAVPSFCSLIQSLHKLYYEEDCKDDKLLGRKMLEVSEQMLNSAPKRIEESKLPCSDVIYNQLVADPIQTVKDIYLQFGWNYTSEYEARLQHYLKQDKIHRDELKAKKLREGNSNMHSYTPEEFGLTAEQLSSGVYAEYVKRYHIPLSKN